MDAEWLIAPRLALNNIDIPAMHTWLVTWNPKKWPWKSFERDLDSARKKGYLDEGWNVCSRSVAPGDRLFLLRQGIEPRGLIASGYATSNPYEGRHFSEPTKMALYVEARWNPLLHFGREPILSRSRLRQPDLSAVHWDTQKSGISIQPSTAARLERVWADFLSSRGYAPCSPLVLADEVPAAERFWEGAVRRVTVNAYERDPLAREACIKHYGTSCLVCGLSFSSTYGDLGQDLIHVHHVRPLASLRKQYAVDPIADLRPVCPNCHAVIHYHDPPISIEALKARVRHQKRRA